jgi:hypothetical protein
VMPAGNKPRHVHWQELSYLARAAKLYGWVFLQISVWNCLTEFTKSNSKHFVNLPKLQCWRFPKTFGAASHSELNLVWDWAEILR